MDEERMSCPRCGKEMRKGWLEEPGRTIYRLQTLRWYPEESEGKLFKKGVITFDGKAKAFYCDGCSGAFVSLQIDPFSY